MIAAVTSTLFISSCKKDKDDVTLPPIGGYNNSDEIAATNLVAKWSFENNIDDSKASVTGGSSSNISYIAGAKGQAWKGSIDGYSVFTNPGTLLPALQSVTVAFWVNTTIHTDGAKGLFVLSDTSSWIGNLFVLQESGIIGEDSVRFKFKFDNWDAPSWKEQWIDLSGQYKVAAITGKWAHLAFSYDGITSKFYAYVNGVKMVLPDSFTNRYGSDPLTGGTALGNLKFQAATKFVFGAYQNMVGVGGAPDAWMKNYDGGLDEFRIYNKSLSDTDVNSLYELEKAGR
jgi:hypothetical protein